MSFSETDERNAPWPWRIEEIEVVMEWYRDTKHLHGEKVAWVGNHYQKDFNTYAANFTRGDDVCTGVQLNNLLKGCRKRYTGLKGKVTASGSEAFDINKYDRKTQAIWGCYDEVLGDKYGGKTVGPQYRSKTVSILNLIIKHYDFPITDPELEQAESDY